jgi:hypothetical protein
MNPESDHASDQGIPWVPKNSNPSRLRLVFARMLIGWIVLICAEVFSGASLHMGLWHPWTLIVTYWLYFSHFFLFTTLAVRTRRTSLSSLYLWGVLYGLYESWVTKVIWHGYSGDGKFVLGSIGPFGFSEISMVFLFHPVMSFLMPLAVACLLLPSLRSLFPDLAWFTGESLSARLIRYYIIFSIVPIIVMNSGGPLNLVANLIAAMMVLFILARLARPTFVMPDARRVVVFSRTGLIGLCVYIGLLYGVTYFGLRPEGLPSMSVQLFTILFYAVIIVGLWRHREAELPQANAPQASPRELKTILRSLAVVLLLALAFSPLAGWPGLFAPILPNFCVWTPLGFLLTVAALVRGRGGQELRTSDFRQP